MARKVAISQKVAEELVELQRQAEQHGMRAAFRQAWITIWKALHERPLPPEESEVVFGEILYRTKHPPIHSVNLCSVRPLTVKFSVCEEPVITADGPVKLIFVLGAVLMV